MRGPKLGRHGSAAPPATKRLRAPRANSFGRSRHNFKSAALHPKRVADCRAERVGSSGIKTSMRSEMKSFKLARPAAALLMAAVLLVSPLAVLAKKGEKNFNRGVDYEKAEQWEKAAQ